MIKIIAMSRHKYKVLPHASRAGKPLVPPRLTPLTGCMDNQSPATVAATPKPLPFPLLAAVLGLMSMFGAISIDMYLPALPALEAALQTDPASVQMTLGGFLLGFGFAQLLFGPLSDSIGRRRVMISGIMLYVIGSLLCAMAETATDLILARVLQGLGASAGPVMARAMVRDLFARDESAKIYSILMLLMGAAPMIAPVAGGQLLVYFDWRAIFWALTAFGLLCLAVAVLLAPETLPRTRRSAGSIRTALHHYRDLLRSRTFLGYALTLGFLYAAMFTYIAGTPHVYITVMGVSAQDFGYLFGVNVVGMMALSALNSRIVTRVGSDRMLGYGLLLSLFGAVLLLITALGGFFGLAGIAVPLFILLASLGMIGANGTAGALAAFPTMAGAASALGGVLPFVVGTGAGFVLGLFHDPSPRPMAIIIVTLVILGFLTHRLLVVNTKAR